MEDLNAAGILTFDVDIIIGTQTRSLECWDGVSFRSEVKSNSNPAKERWSFGEISAQSRTQRRHTTRRGPVQNQKEKEHTYYWVFICRTISCRGDQMGQ